MKDAINVAVLEATFHGGRGGTSKQPRAQSEAEGARPIDGIITSMAQQELNERPCIELPRYVTRADSPCWQ